MTLLDSENLEVMRKELTELTQELNSILLSLENKIPNTDEFDIILRLLHSVKGLISFLGENYKDIVELTHSLESRISQYVEKNIQLPNHEINDLLKYIDGINKLSASLGQELDKSFVNKLFAALLQEESFEEISLKFETEYEIVILIPKNLAMKSSRVLSILNSLKKISTVKSSKPSREEILNDEGSLKEVKIHVITKEGLPRVKDFISGFNFIDGYEIKEYDSEKEFEKIKGALELQSQLSSGYSITESDMQKMGGLLAELFRLESVIAKTDTSLLNRNEQYLMGNFRDHIFEMQTIMNKIRLLPIHQILNSMRHHVSNTAKKFDKEVDFFVAGEDIRFERNIVDGLMDPLIILLNNAIVHGIEDPQTREKNGKPPKGMIRIQAIALENKVVIRVFDNGKGLDFEKLWEIGINKGLVEGPFDPVMSKQLIFRPKFSSTEKISQVAGRGMGLTQVSQFVSRFNGTISVESKVGHNSVFELSFPVQSRIASVLTVLINNQEFGFPENHIENIVRLSTINLLSQPLFDQETRYGIIETINLPLILSNIREESSSKSGSIIIWNNGVRRLGFYVDDIFNFEELSINFSDPINNISPYFNGAVTKANGEMMFYLNPAAFIHAENIVEV